MLISWNTTRRCNQFCAHCYRSAGPEADPRELSTEEGKQLIAEIARAGFRLLVLSGGEPLLREDLLELVAATREQGLRPVLGTNGTLLTAELVRELQTAGAARVGISLDHTDPAQHDQWRGMSGAWEQTVAAMARCREAGLPFQMHTTVTDRNQEVITDLTDMAVQLGAAAHHIFFLVPTGRGEHLEAESLRAADYERLLSRLADKQQQAPIELKPTCAPQFMRLARRRGLDLRFTKGCLAGTSYCVIVPNGDVQPCPYLPLPVGNVRETPFSQIWATSPVFADLRTGALGGRCGACDCQDVCGGCRARAYYYSGGDYLAEEPWCLYRQEAHPA
ncbi:MAG TPA: putative heme d1 biosynthesis radical SAM protein NirJ2 [Armatimonadota bacterium]|jgi:putative heme d1 biosynthesis radical SAM protein NirJ2